MENSPSDTKKPIHKNLEKFSLEAHGGYFNDGCILKATGKPIKLVVKTLNKMSSLLDSSRRICTLDIDPSTL